jgi:hypothetical protein
MFGVYKLLLTFKEKLLVIRQFGFKSDLRKYNEMVIFWFNVMQYLIDEFKTSESKKAKFYLAAMITYTHVRYTDAVFDLYGAYLRGGIVSQSIKNINNRILPPGLVPGASIEGIRTAQELVLTPYCVLQRIFYEAREVIGQGLKYTFNVLYDVVSEHKFPEISQVVKVGIFLIVGYLSYKYVLSESSPIRKWLKGEAKNEEIQQDLVAEMDNGNTQIKILTKHHHGIPEDGFKYKHYHQCERCRNVYAHTHSIGPKSHEYQLICRKCRQKCVNRMEDLKKSGKKFDLNPKVDHSESEDSYESASDDEVVTKGDIRTMIAEAVHSSGGATREKFIKRSSRKLRAESAVKTTRSTYDKMDKIREERGKEEDQKKGTMATLRSIFGLTKAQPPEDHSDVQPQSSNDEDAIVLMNRIAKNIGRIHVAGGKVNVLFLKKRWLVTVFHIFQYRNSESLPYTVEVGGIDYPGLLNMEKHVYRRPSEVMWGKKVPDDMVIIDLCENKRLPEFSDITNHFITESDLPYVCGNDGVMIIKRERGNTFHNFHVKDIQDDVSIRCTDVISIDGIDVQIQSGTAHAWKFNADTLVGDCGSPVIVKNRCMQRKIIGFHFGGARGTNTVFSHIVTQEMIFEAVPRKEIVMQMKLDDIDEYMEEVFDCTPEELPEDHGLRFVPQGRVKIYGRLKPEWVTALPRKTDIVPSPYMDMIYPHTTEPAVLTDRDPRSPGNIVQGGLDKFGRPLGHPRSMVKMRKIINFRVKEQIKLLQEYTGPMRTLTEDEAINGIMGNDHIPPIKMDSAPGFPFNKLRPQGQKGKKWFFEEIEPFPNKQPRYKPKPLLRKVYKEDK